MVNEHWSGHDKESAGSRGQAALASHAPWKETYAAWDLPTAAKRVAEGLPTQALAMVQERLELAERELAHLMLISPQTLTQRKQEVLLPPDESERVYRVARLTEVAADVFNSRDAARQWMKEPNYALGEQTPLEVARTEPGAMLVENLLGHIGHGVTI